MSKRNRKVTRIASKYAGPVVYCRECKRAYSPQDMVKWRPNWCKECQKKYMRQYLETHLADYARRNKEYRLRKRLSAI